MPSYDFVNGNDDIRRNNTVVTINFRLISYLPEVTQGQLSNNVVTC